MKRFAGYLATLLPRTDDYRMLRRTWRGDVLAGVTVGVVALPLALGFGISSGAGIESGLITAIVAGIVAGVFGGSNVQVSGPTGAMAVILAPIAIAHGPAAIATVSVLAGVIVLAAGLMKLGRIVALVPWPVIEGFTLGIAVIIFLQQVPAALGEVQVPSAGALSAAVNSVGAASWSAAWVALLIAGTVAAVMAVGARIHERIPASLVAIVVVSVAARVLDLPVETIGFVPDGLPAPVFPLMSVELIGALLGPAAAVAALAAIESLLSARVAAGMRDTGAFDPDRELIGQGAASLISGMFGGMPATGAIARTAVNVRSGARSRLSTITHALVLIAIVYLAAPLVSQIPRAALAGVLMFTAVRMISPRLVTRVIRSSRGAAATFIATAVVTVSFDLIVAVGIGVAVTAIFALRAVARSAGVHRDALPAPGRDGDERIEVLRIDGSLFFGSAERVLADIRATQADVVILRMSQLNDLDATGAHALSDLIGELERRGVTVLVKGIQPKHQGVASGGGVLASLRHQRHLFSDLDEAIAHARSHVDRSGARPVPGTSGVV